MKVVLLSPGAKIPTRANNYAAVYDLYAPEDFEVKPGRNILPLGLRIELDPHTEGMIRPRSGFSAKGMEGKSLDNSKEVKRFDADVIIGTIDEDFRGIPGVIIKSFESKPFIIEAGTKVAQMVVHEYCSQPFEVVDELSKTERADQGWGHTGTK